MTTDDTTTAREVAFGTTCHPACFACRSADRGGLGLRFEQDADGGVAARFACDERYQGYPDRLHGGVVAMLLDAAMVHCLFARGICGVTAKMEIRYRHPVMLNVPATVRARVESDARSLYILKAEIVQDGRVRAQAEGLFAEGDPPAVQEAKSHAQ